MKRLNNRNNLPVVSEKTYCRDSVMKKVTKTPGSNRIKYTKIEDLPVKITPFRYILII